MKVIGRCKIFFEVGGVGDVTIYNNILILLRFLDN